MQVTDEALRDVVAYLYEHLPNEACGVIAGKNGTATRMIPISNVHRKPEHFFAFEPEAWLKTNEDVEEAGEEIVCVFHSHPNSPAELSSFDIRNTYYVAGEVPWLVVSFAGTQIAGAEGGKEDTREVEAGTEVAVWETTDAGEVFPVDVEIVPVLTQV